MATKRKISEETSTDTLIKREVNRLTKLFVEVEQKRRLASKGLIEEAAFMRVTLGELKNQINAEGPIDEMQQGEYSILREHPALRSYNTTLQRYSGVIKQLTDLLPKEQQKPMEDEFDDFLLSK